MLVLSRKRNERIMIGEDVSVVILGIQGNKVKLGIECPREVSVLRSELAASPPITMSLCTTSSLVTQ